jgi:hypothetical protein
MSIEEDMARTGWNVPRTAERQVRGEGRPSRARVGLTL